MHTKDHCLLIKKGTTLPPGGRRSNCATAPLMLTCCCFYFQGWKLSRPKQKLRRETKEETDMNSSISHSWITQTCSVFSTLKGYFGSSLISWRSRFCFPPEATHCIPQHDNQTATLSSTQLTFQPGSDLCLQPNTGGERTLPAMMNTLSVRIH